MKDEKDCWLDLIGSVPTDMNFFKWSLQDKSTWLINNIRYLHTPRKITNHEYTLWIAVDLEVSSGRKLLKETLDYLVNNLNYTNFIILYFHWR